MQKEQFFQILHAELMRRGIPAETASRHVRAIAQTLSQDDIADIEKIQNTSEIAALAQAIVAVRQRPAANAENQAAASAAPTENARPDDTARVYTSYSSQQVRREENISQVRYEDVEDISYEDIIRDDDEESAATAHGKRVFWIVFLCTIPITLALLCVYFGIFAAIFCVLCAAIVLLVAGLIGGVALGAAVSLVGIIYGITQLITAASSAPGLYEIGLGVGIGGAVMLGGILVYNLALRLIPLLIRWLGSLFRYCTGKLKDIFRMAKEACYKL